MKKTKKDPLLYKEYREESHVRLAPTQTALILDTKGTATIQFGRDMKDTSKLQWPELLLASIFIVIGEKDLDMAKALMDYTGRKLKPYAKETKNAKVRLHSTGHKCGRVHKRKKCVWNPDCGDC